MRTVNEELGHKCTSLLNTFKIVAFAASPKCFLSLEEKASNTLRALLHCLVDILK